MSQRRTSLSAPLGILSMLLLFGCSRQERDWSATETGGAGGRETNGGSAGTTDNGDTGGSTGTEGGAESTGGRSGSNRGGQGGTSAGGSSLGDTSAGGTFAGGTSAQGGTLSQISCTTNAECDDGNFCNGVEYCDGQFCAQGTATTNSCGGCTKLTVEPGGNCGVCGGSLYTCDGTDAVVCKVQTAASRCFSNSVLQYCVNGAWANDVTCSDVCAAIGGFADCVDCVPASVQCDSGGGTIQTCDGTGTWQDTEVCQDQTVCKLNASSTAYECGELSPGDLENDFQLPEQLPEHQYQYRGPRALKTHELLDLASGFALA